MKQLENTLALMLPDSCEYIGNFYKEDVFYYFTVTIPEDENFEIPYACEVVSIENGITLFVRLRIDADWLEYQKDN